VLIYCFSIHSADGGDRETCGRMALANDNAARAFGKPKKFQHCAASLGTEVTTGPSPTCRA
jgi:hypothetical protein